MKFLLANTFSKALSKLTAQEQKAVKITVFDLQQNPSSSALSFHRIEKCRDPNFWSIRANRDIRLIIHKTDASFLVCYVDHHDDAYQWAQRRRLETHPRTGAAQIVEVRERIEEIPVFKPAATPEQPSINQLDPVQLPLFAHFSEDDLLGYGVPTDWISDIMAVRDEDSFMNLTEHLPQEAGEALLDLYAGKTPEMPTVVEASADPFAHPDALRRFRVMDDKDELEQALDYPWDQWTVFLHPSQRKAVAQNYNGPARVSGSAGTGKTVVALHRVKNLLRQNAAARLLLTTFSLPLANTLKRKLEILVGKDKNIVPRVTVLPFNKVAAELFALAYGYEPRAIRAEKMNSFLLEAAKSLGVTSFTDRFLVSEWHNVVDAWQVHDLENYKTVPRLGRKSRMSAKKREMIWPVFEAARVKMAKEGLLSWPDIFGQVSDYYSGKEQKPFSHVVVDEAQDLGVPELRMMAAIVPQDGANSLFFAGDLGQRIFQEPFSWKSLGINITGRSRTLKVNYRTSHQIRKAADQLLPASIRDVDGNEETRGGTVSIFNGPVPDIQNFADEAAEKQGIIDWITEMVAQGVEPAEIGIFVRTLNELGRARVVVQGAGHSQMELSERSEDPAGRISIGTMHLAKGLEFKAVIVMACDEDVLPLQERIESIVDEADLDEVYETERHLFYVACTRAREHLLVSGVQPASEFFEDMGSK